MQSHQPCHPAVQAPSQPPPCRVPRNTRGRPRVRNSRALSHGHSALCHRLACPLLDSLVHCAGASLGRPKQLGGPMRARPIRASPARHERLTATTVAGCRAARRHEGTRGRGLRGGKCFRGGAYGRGGPVDEEGLWEGQTCWRGGAGWGRGGAGPFRFLLMTALDFWSGLSEPGYLQNW